MASSINASLTAGLVSTADTTGDLNLQSGGTTRLAVTSTGVAVTGTLSASGAITGTSLSGALNGSLGATTPSTVAATTVTATTVNASLNGSLGATTPSTIVATNVNTPNTFGFKNRIINGAMVIDQRNNGASVTPTAIAGQYTLDRWNSDNSTASKYSVQRNAGSVTPPAGYINYLGVTSLAATALAGSDFYQIEQFIEGLNITDLGWGTANAQTVTLSFWVRSSLTGTFGGSFTNGAANRSYPYSYTISSANTWEQKTITIAGDTTGTWLTTNGIGVCVRFSLGMGTTYSSTAGSWQAGIYASVTGATSVVGTNGATFYITGVQLEKGSTATSFDVRDYGNELRMCQRYYYRTTPSTNNIFGVTTADSTTTSLVFVPYPVPMRTQPSALEQTGTATDYYTQIAGTNRNCSAVPTHIGRCSINYGICGFTVASGYTAGQGGSAFAAGTAAYLGWSAEL